MDQAESLRNIIKKQEIDEKKRTARVITVTSGKGGVGKTSFSVNLAIQLHRLGKRVVVLDADFGLANIEIIFQRFVFRHKMKVSVFFPAVPASMRWQI